VLAPEEARTLIDSIEITTPAGLRDRALIGLMVFSFARIGAALGMKVEDVFTQNRRLCGRFARPGGGALGDVVCGRIRSGARHGAAQVQRTTVWET
jgi:integrase